MVEDYFTKALSDANVAKTATEVEINLVKDNSKGWLIKSDKNLENAMTGNISKAFENMNTNNNSELETKADPKLYIVGEEAKIGKASITIKKVEKSNNGEYDKPKEGMDYNFNSLLKISLF